MHGFWRIVAVIGLCVAGAVPAAAGAWLREAGTGFAAYETRLRSGQPDEGSAYLEFGLSPRVTLGGDLNLRSDGVGHALGFARVPLLGQDGNSRLAVELGVGAHLQGGGVNGMGRVLLQYGRTLGHNGWFGVEGGVEHRQGLGAPLLKLDGVVGLPARGRWQGMVKVETIYKSGYGPGVAVTPSLIWSDRAGRRWVGGVEMRSGGGARSVGIIFSLWQRF